MNFWNQPMSFAEMQALINTLGIWSFVLGMGITAAIWSANRPVVRRMVTGIAVSGALSALAVAITYCDGWFGWLYMNCW